MIITAVFHHIVFFGFSSEHDYAALKMAFPIVFIAAIFITGMKKNIALVVTPVIFFGVAQYFFLHNYPYRKGMYEDEDFFVKAGKEIRWQPQDKAVFINTENNYYPQIEFYAGRAYKIAANPAEMSVLMNKENIQEAIFIDVETGATTGITKFGSSK